MIGSCKQFLRFHVFTCAYEPRRVQSSAAEMSKQQRLMDELELRRRMKAVVVPTDDAEVRRLLREEGEPITLFGEREVGDVERRGFQLLCACVCARVVGGGRGLRGFAAHGCVRVWPSPIFIACPCSWNGPSGCAGCMRRAARQAPPEVGGGPAGGGHGFGRGAASAGLGPTAQIMRTIPAEAPVGAYEAPPSTSELFYTEGSEELQQARLQVTRAGGDRAAVPSPSPSDVRGCRLQAACMPLVLHGRASPLPCSLAPAGSADRARVNLPRGQALGAGAGHA